MPEAIRQTSEVPAGALPKPEIEQRRQPQFDLIVRLLEQVSARLDVLQSIIERNYAATAREVVADAEPGRAVGQPKRSAAEQSAKPIGDEWRDTASRILAKLDAIAAGIQEIKDRPARFG